MFLLAEDEALHRALRGIQVDDRAAQRRNERREVSVRYRFPENEVKDEDYPFITLDLRDVARASHREHRGRIRLDYTPDEPEYEPFRQPVGTPDDRPFITYPIPYDLIYQVTTYSRYAWQDRQIQRHLLQYPFNRDGSSIDVGGPQADTVEHRWSEDITPRVLSVSYARRADTRDRGNRRVFRQVYGVTLESELPPPIAEAASAAITQILITVQPKQDNVLAAG